MVVVGTGGVKSRFIKTKWPIEEGTTAGTTKTHENQLFLIPEEKSLVSEKDKEGIN